MNYFILMFMVLTIAFLAPIWIFILNWVLFFIGKILWISITEIFPKLKPGLIEVIVTGNADILYVETAIIFSFIVVVIMKVLS